jgi:site-specific recombinase XerD
MITNLKKILRLCEDELVDRQYGVRLSHIKKEWEKLSQWMKVNDHTTFSEKIGFAYCTEAFGSHLLLDSMDRHKKIGLRATRMLISFQKSGDFEFRTPRIEYRYHGLLGKAIKSYLSFARNDLLLSNSTIRNKEFYLYPFNTYMTERSLGIDNLNIAIVDNYIQHMGYSLASQHNCRSALRSFLRFVYENGLSKKNLSLCITRDNYKKQCKLPTTYKEDEIKAMLSSVERSSAIGKRDYVILLLAAEYGWRTKDIISLRFDQIDWDNNSISIVQNKTQLPAVYPLLSSVGNAIIDYMKFGRPKTDTDIVIVSGESSKMGKALSSPTVHSIVSKYLRKANIENWKGKKHGAHSLRHSLASNLLKNNVSLPIISMIMGHQNTESTKRYVSIDIDKLRRCALPIPKIMSPHYKKKGA